MLDPNIAESSKHGRIYSLWKDGLRFLHMVRSAGLRRCGVRSDMRVHLFPQSVCVRQHVRCDAQWGAVFKRTPRQFVGMRSFATPSEFNSSTLKKKISMLSRSHRRNKKALGSTSLTETGTLIFGTRARPLCPSFIKLYLLCYGWRIMLTFSCNSTPCARIWALVIICIAVLLSLNIVRRQDKSFSFWTLEMVANSFQFPIDSSTCFRFRNLKNPLWVTLSLFCSERVFCNLEKPREIPSTAQSGITCMFNPNYRKLFASIQSL